MERYPRSSAEQAVIDAVLETPRLWGIFDLSDWSTGSEIYAVTPHGDSWENIKHIPRPMAFMLCLTDKTVGYETNMHSYLAKVLHIDSVRPVSIPSGQVTQWLQDFPARDHILEVARQAEDSGSGLIKRASGNVYDHPEAVELVDITKRRNAAAEHLRQVVKTPEASVERLAAEDAYLKLAWERKQAEAIYLAAEKRWRTNDQL